MRIVLVGFAVLLVIAAGAFFRARQLMARAPQWWHPPLKADPETIDTAKAVENGVTTLLHQARPRDASWTMQVSNEDANAWLGARLQDWFDNQGGSKWPKELEQVSAQFEDGALRVGAALDLRGTRRVVSLRLEPRIDDRGQLWLPATSVQVGELGVPTGWVLGDASPLRSMIRADPGEMDRLSRVLAGQSPLASKPTLKLADGRRVRVTGLKLESGQLLVTCQGASAD